MTQHTKGPWKIDLESEFDCGYCRTSSGIVGADGSLVVAFDPSQSEYREALDPESADARLIAAAPCMYLALKDIVEFWDSIVPTDAVNQMHINARAAIAKATTN